MGITKTDAIKQLEIAGSNVANQQALVKKLAGTQLQKQIKHVIPGGKSLTENVAKEDLSATIFTWLRRVRHFKDVLLTMSADLSKLETRQYHAVDFDTKQRQPEWEIHGKRWLAERMADVLKEDNIVAIKVDKNGILAYQDSTGSFSPENENWEPNLIFTPHKPGV